MRVLFLSSLDFKEKSIAALRAGVEKVLIPAGNAKDVPELPEEVRQRIEIVPVSSVDDVIKHALEAPSK